MIKVATRGSIVSSIDLEFVTGRVTRPSFDKNLRLPAAFHDFHLVESDSFEAGYEKGELSLPPPRYRYNSFTFSPCLFANPFQPFPLPSRFDRLFASEWIRMNWTDVALFFSFHLNYVPLFSQIRKEKGKKGKEKKGEERRARWRSS